MPGTRDLTDRVRLLKNPVVQADTIYSSSIPIAEAMWRMASSYYAQPNFETMLHLLETAMAYSGIKGWLAVDDRAKAAFGAFMTIMPQWRQFIESAMLYSFSEFYSGAIGAIAAMLIEGADENEGRISEYCTPFLAQMRDHYELTIATLNYDDILERSLGEWHDGFVQANNSLWRFSPSSLLEQAANPTILHLHGSIRFYTLQEDGDRTEIYRSETSSLQAPKTRQVQWHDFAQSGDTLIVGPMLSPPFQYRVRPIDRT
jgi:hypothetical protein